METQNEFFHLYDKLTNMCHEIRLPKIYIAQFHSIIMTCSDVKKIPSNKIVSKGESNSYFHV